MTNYVKLKKRIKSKIDKTEKFILELPDGLLTEFSYINKDDGKIIICASTQTGCNMGCTFCHLTGEKLQKIRGLTRYELEEAVLLIEKDMTKEINTSNKTLLISYMGVGEPLNNTTEVLYASDFIESKYFHCYKNVRFAVSTMIPKDKLADLFFLVREMTDRNLELKLHYSLHSLGINRRILMPNALEFHKVINNLEYIKEYFGVTLEIHWTLIKGMNDNLNALTMLAAFCIPVKFLKLAEKKEFEGESYSFEEYEKTIKPIFDRSDRVCEYYDPPGADVGASCGQISLEVYQNVLHNSEQHLQREGTRPTDRNSQ